MTLNDQTLVQDDAAAEWDFHTALVEVLPSLRQQAYALTRNRADADDLVQAAVGNALAAKNSFQPGTNFKAWMLRIVRNRFLSDMRRKRETVAVEDAPAEIFARSGGQEDSLVMQELRRNLARLPADQRLALMMVTVQGMSYEEVSEELGVAVGTLKCRVFRARKQLEAWLMGEEAPSRSKAPRAAKTAGAQARDSRNMRNDAAGISLQH
ncbi:sigma-70 family RNA polymerase sigma factor [Rhodovarius crocodyli]|uniref:Sigma-70 family RNA polymerase sigma factor n=1 Tax=Rhodovarius crocodyli TaxID=1979269 RepID=A0A437M360_9PROT|nr:sigma-70 family RNA polymerase sigma factor [Rhodovarius crocodyli]RVT92026.1 sigma-70 family RNA polymerase sigma factor [Rhodovarius crocodyli]